MSICYQAYCLVFKKLRITSRLDFFNLKIRQFWLKTIFFGYLLTFQSKLYSKKIFVLGKKPGQSFEQLAMKSIGNSIYLKVLHHQRVADQPQIRSICHLHRNCLLCLLKLGQLLPQMLCKTKKSLAIDLSNPKVFENHRKSLIQHCERSEVMFTF